MTYTPSEAVYPQEVPDVHLMNELPLTTIGKVAKKRLLPRLAEVAGGNA